MEWEIKYEAATREMPWSVYKTFNGQRIYEEGFLTEEEAVKFADKKERAQERPESERKVNKVDEASIESFPASDSPSWTKTTVHSVNDEQAPNVEG